ncbi:MAG TPA: AAA family ATPase [Marmoricola sp.]|nr:AAA family ATPase [Marmoricola sp.]
MRPLHVLVGGPPASGKSTLAPALARELGLPLLAKDTVKEALVDVLGADDVDASRRLGRAAVEVLFALAREAGSAVVESVWHRSYAPAQVARLPGDVVEVFCRAPLEVLTARYRERAGTRHGGHFDAVRTPEELFGPETCEPLAGPWPLVEVDTSRPVEVVALARLVRDLPLGTAGRFTSGC